MGYDLDRVRDDFPILDQWTYLNTGTLGVLPEPVLHHHLENIADYERGGHTGEVSAREGYERARQRIAALLSIPAQEVALNRNATDGINTIVAGFPLQDGDEVITSSEEHPALVLPLLAACQRAGAHLRFVNVTADSTRFAASLDAIVSDRTRLVALSHVSCETGTRMPVEIIRNRLPDRARVLIDASQSIGQFQIQLHDLRADYVVGNGHKWLCGPNGTGFVWIDPNALDDVQPVLFASNVVDPPWSRAYYQHEPGPALRVNPIAQRFEFGTRAWHQYGALADAVDYLDDLGLTEIETHARHVLGYLKQRLGELENVTLHTPLDWNSSSGIVTFSVDGWTGEALSRHLWDIERIAQRRVEAPSAVRISCAFFTSEADIDRLIAALQRLTSETLVS